MSSPEISSLQETFSRILRIEVSSSSSRQAVLLLDKPLSQSGNEIETVVQAITLEGLVLEVLFVIIAICLAM